MRDYTALEKERRREWKSLYLCTAFFPFTAGRRQLFCYFLLNNVKGFKSLQKLQGSTATQEVARSIGGGLDPSKTSWILGLRGPRDMILALIYS